MASSLKCVTIILLVAFCSSMQLVFARDSQFFSKVTKNNVNNDKETTTMNQINNNEYKQEQVDEDPLFVPESETGGYALYGHESGQLPPSTTYEPYTTVATGYVPRQEKTSTGVQFSQETYNNNNNYYNRNTYDANHPQETNMGDTSFAEKTYTTNNNNDQESQNINSYRQQFVNNNNNNKQYNNEKQGMSDTRFLENGKYHYDLKNENQRQGMSDTRFMENGKYFYDVKNENTYNPNQYHENSYSKGSGSVSYNNNNGGGYNYGNNNNGNTYEYNNNNNNNNMAEFQNAEVDEDNFNDEQFEP
ncbi:hypothetical protein ACFE04_020422 [Oxalis oulophora]